MTRIRWTLPLAVILLGGCQPGPEMIAVRPEPGAVEALPSFDQERFRASAQSIARADLLACRNPEARFTRAGDADPDELARRLHGTWIGRRRSLHGDPVETDQIFLIDARGGSGQGLLIDRTNLKPVFTPQYAPARVTESIGMVDCTYQLVDSYEKVSDDVDIAALARGTGVALREDADLAQAWEQLVRAGYFERFEMAVGPRDATRPVRDPRLGDRSRVAVFPGGRVYTEEQIERGAAPGAENRLPTLTGGFFKMTLEPERVGRFTGVNMRWDAVYRGAGLALEPGEEVRGVERGTFLKEGDAYVSAMGPDLEQGMAWSTSACGAKHDLTGMASVSNPALGADHAGHAHDQLTFTRVVLGTP